MKRSAAILCLLALPSCGGGSTPAGPSNPAPTPTPAPTIVNNMDAAGDPSIGSTITVDECGGRCTSDVTIQILETHNQPVNPGEVYVQLFDTGGRQCASGFSAQVNVTAGRVTEFLTDRLDIQCGLPFTTNRLHATLFGPNPGNLPVSQRSGLYDENFTGGWTFKAPGGSGGNPQPKPTPKPTPKPPTPNGYPACPGTHSGPGCGSASGQCNDGTYTCSQHRSGTCSSHNGIKCVFCPGPICQGIVGVEGEAEPVDENGIDWSTVGLSR